MTATFEWSSSPAESQGFSPEKLEVMRAEAASRNTKALLVIRNDHVVCEWYADVFGPDRKHFTASLVKALAGGTSLALAVTDGLMDPDDPVCSYVPQWRGDPVKSRITIRHLATHTSGLANPGGPSIVAADPALIRGWQGRFWPDLKSFARLTGNEALVPEADPFRVARDEAPVLFEPGTEYHYSNPGMAMLSCAVTVAIQGGPHRDVRTLLAHRIMRPLGVPDGACSIGYENVVGPGGFFETDGLPLVDNWGGGAFTPRATARVGRLMLKGGVWQGRRLLGEQAAHRATTFAGLPGSEDQDLLGASGLGWWTNDRSQWDGLPEDAFCGAGHHDQILLVVPSLNLILVRNGQHLGDDFGLGVVPYLFRPLMAALAP